MDDTADPSDPKQGGEMTVAELRERHFPTAENPSAAARQAAPRRSGRATGSQVPAAPATPRRGRKPPPENETKRDRFLRIGKHRMRTALARIDMIGNLAGPVYDVREEDIAKMRDSLCKAVDRTLARFDSRRKQRDAAEFTF